MLYIKLQPNYIYNPLTKFRKFVDEVLTNIKTRNLFENRYFKIKSEK